MDTNRFKVLAIPVAAAALALASCGGEADTARGSSKADFREAALKHAQCMREHGIDLPDPKPGGNGGFILAGPGGDVDKGTWQRAERACRKYLKDLRPPDMSPEQQQEFRDQALKHARCMRSQGIDIPDPTFGDNGGAQLRLPNGSGPGDPRFDRAQEKCSKFGPSIEGGS